MLRATLAGAARDGAGWEKRGREARVPALESFRLRRLSPTDRIVQGLCQSGGWGWPIVEMSAQATLNLPGGCAESSLYPTSWGKMESSMGLSQALAHKAHETRGRGDVQLSCGRWPNLLSDRLPLGQTEIYNLAPCPRRRSRWESIPGSSHIE